MIFVKLPKHGIDGNSFDYLRDSDGEPISFDNESFARKYLYMKGWSDSTIDVEGVQFFDPASEKTSRKNVGMKNEVTVIAEKKLHQAVIDALSEYGTLNFSAARNKFEALGEMACALGAVTARDVEEIRKYETKRWAEERKAAAPEEKMYHLVFQLTSEKRKKEMLFKEEDFLDLNNGPLALIAESVGFSGFKLGPANNAIAGSVSDVILNDPGANFFDVHLSVAFMLHKWENSCNRMFSDTPLEQLVSLQWQDEENDYLVLGKKPLDIVENYFKVCLEQGIVDSLTFKEVSSGEVKNIKERMLREEDRGR